MGQTTGISWTHHTANFWIGCQKVSPGCEHCYAEHDTPTRTRRAKGLELWGPPKTTPRDRTKGAWKDVLSGQSQMSLALGVVPRTASPVMVMLSPVMKPLLLAAVCAWVRPL